jgi:hypothetical protein
MNTYKNKYLKYKKKYLQLKKINGGNEEIIKLMEKAKDLRKQYNIIQNSTIPDKKKAKILSNITKEIYEINDKIEKIIMEISKADTKNNSNNVEEELKSLKKNNNDLNTERRKLIKILDEIKINYMDDEEIKELSKLTFKMENIENKINENTLKISELEDKKVNNYAPSSDRKVKISTLECKKANNNKLSYDRKAKKELIIYTLGLSNWNDCTHNPTTCIYKLWCDYIKPKIVSVLEPKFILTIKHYDNWIDIPKNKCDDDNDFIRKYFNINEIDRTKEHLIINMAGVEIDKEDHEEFFKNNFIDMYYLQDFIKDMTNDEGKIKDFKLIELKDNKITTVTQNMFHENKKTDYIRKKIDEIFREIYIKLNNIIATIIDPKKLPLYTNKREQTLNQIDKIRGANNINIKKEIVKQLYIDWKKLDEIETIVVDIFTKRLSKIKY